MLLTISKGRLDVRSSEDMNIDELCRLKPVLESSDVITSFIHEHKPKRGIRRFSFISLLLLYLYMECRKTTYRGIVRNLSDHECVCLGLIDDDGHPRRPSYATLNWFVNGTLAPMAAAIGDEFAAAVLKTMDVSSFTLDSTPLQASRYNEGAVFNPHYNIKMDKSHILMANGYPLYQIHSDGGANDGPFAAPLIDRLPGAHFAPGRMGFHTDGGYDSFRTYAQVYLATGAVMRCNQGTNAVCSDVDENVIRIKYGRMWMREGYDPHRKNDFDYMLRFLCRHGEEVLVGKHLRDRSMLLSAEDGSGAKNIRQVCETMHRAMKRWVDFSIFRLVKRTKEGRVRCRFLCLQLLSVLFKGYVDIA